MLIRYLRSLILILWLPSSIANTLLAPDSPIQNSVQRYAWQYYSVTLPAEPSQVTIRMDGMDADADLYVSKKGTPSADQYDCRPYFGGYSKEICEMKSPAAGTWYIGVNGYNTANYTLTVSFAESNTETVYLLLHGLNSSPDTWNQVVDDLFDGKCPKIVGDSRDYSTTPTNCYRYHFQTRHVSGQDWPNGDGSTYPELGQEVALAMMSVEQLNQAQSVILVCHSRGGLAARAYLQSLTTPPAYKIGLLTLGTPHQGSPFGRMKYWMDAHNFTTDDVYLSALEFVFSPSTGYLATDYTRDGNPKRSAISEAIWALNDNVAQLPNVVDSFGQLFSEGLALGEDAVGYLDLLAGFRAARVLPGDFDDLRNFILQNLNDDLWQDGDGIVPAQSQQMQHIPGFTTAGKGLWTLGVQDIVHADAISFDFWDSTPNDGETGRLIEIRSLLESMTTAEGFTAFQ